MQFSKGTYTLIFPANIPALGFNTYFIQPNEQDEIEIVPIVPAKPNADITIQNDFLQLTISGATGRLATIVNKVSGIATQVQQDYLWWNASAGKFH